MFNIEEGLLSWLKLGGLCPGGLCLGEFMSYVLGFMIGIYYAFMTGDILTTKLCHLLYIFHLSFVKVANFYCVNEYVQYSQQQKDLPFQTNLFPHHTLSNETTQ